MSRMPKPVIGAVNGVAAGGGFGLALACDVRIASTAARFKPSYFRIAVVPDGGMTYFLPRLVGLARAQTMTFGDELVESHKALEWGLVTKVVAPESLMAESIAYARRLAHGPCLALAKAKDLLEHTFERTLEEQMDAERRENVASAATIDFAEGVRSFFEKREPHFTGH
jgi:2-(1,2-epoxy-1,2-dihydrophenyl)acetyl-CoA isomerase